MKASRWLGIRGAVLVWILYWVGLALVKLGPAAAAIWNATRGPDTDQSSVSVAFMNMYLSLTVTDHGHTTWSGSTHIVELLIRLSAIPLLLLIVWGMTRRSQRAAMREVV